MTSRRRTTAVALLEFAHGGMGVIQGATSCWPGTAARIELRGDQGTIVLEEGRIVTWQLADADDEEEAVMLSLEADAGSGSQDPMGIGSENHRLQIQDLIEAIHDERTPAVAGAEGRKAVEIVRAIYRSTTTGRACATALGG